MTQEQLKALKEYVQALINYELHLAEHGSASRDELESAEFFLDLAVRDDDED